MITKEQYIQALKIVKEYESNKKHISKKCCVCKNKFINTLYETEDIENAIWDSGLVSIIQAGYGSCHDSDYFIISICDYCITDLVNLNLIEKV